MSLDPVTLLAFGKMAIELGIQFTDDQRRLIESKAQQVDMLNIGELERLLIENKESKRVIKEHM